jgi:hypothetical protein
MRGLLVTYEWGQILWRKLEVAVLQRKRLGTDKTHWRTGSGGKT